MASDAYYVENGVIYKIRVNIRDLDECVVVRSSENSVIPAGTVLGRHKWCVMFDEARFRAIRQKDLELSELKQQVADMEHDTLRGKVATDLLEEARSKLRDLQYKVERMKFKNPEIIEIPIPNH